MEKSRKKKSSDFFVEKYGAIAANILFLTVKKY